MICNYKLISKRRCQIARSRAYKLLRDVQIELKDKYRFTYRLVGSGNWGTMIEDANGEYDLDFQILLTKKSKEYKENKLTNPTNVKMDFLKAFNKYSKGAEVFQNSTTAITLVNKDNKPYHIDFVIIRLFPNCNEIIRRNMNLYSSKETFTWNKLPKFNEAYSFFKTLNFKERQSLLINHILPAKYKEKMKSENDKTKLSSSEVFIREINNYANFKRRNN